MVGLPLLGDRAAGFEWFVAVPVVAGVVLILSYRRFLKRALARRQAGVLMCWNCGYDLGATPSPGRCPECGSDFERIELQERWRKMPLR
jgi:rRNA maturation endonuclease Nob1